MEMSFDGEALSTGVGAAALGNPLNAAKWLAQTLTTWGEQLKPGDRLLTGSFGPMVPLRLAVNVQASITGFGCCGFI